MHGAGILYLTHPWSHNSNIAECTVHCQLNGVHLGKHPPDKDSAQTHEWILLLCGHGWREFSHATRGVCMFQDGDWREGNSGADSPQRSNVAGLQAHFSALSSGSPSRASPARHSGN